MVAGFAVAKSAADCLADGSFLVVFSDVEERRQSGDEMKDMKLDEISMDQYPL